MAKKTKDATFNPAANPTDNKLALLAQQLLASKAQEAAKEEKQAVTLDKAKHLLVVNIGKAEAAFNKAEGGRWVATRALVEAVMQDLKSLPFREALYKDIKTTLETMPAVGVQLVTVLNAVAYIVHGRPATRDTAAMVAQGEEPVRIALGACTSLKTFKSALTKLKPVQHASAGVAKVTANGEKAKAAQTPGKAAPATPATAEDVTIPSTRTEAMKAACRVLEFVKLNFLLAGSDADLIGHVDAVTEALKRKAA